MLLGVRKAKATITTTSSAAFATVKHLSTRHSSLLFSTHSTPQNQSRNPTKEDLKTLVLSHYHQGKFHDLLQNVVASPSVLLTACQNLHKPPLPNGLSHHHNSQPQLTLDSVSTRFFSIHHLSSRLIQNSFNVESGCSTIHSSSIHEGKSLVVPNLMLKVVIEAIRMVLEVVYDDRFLTFSYGGRVNMGRHTAIRYLKNSVDNASWWFTASFNREKFDTNHVDKLCTFIQEKVNDSVMIDMIKKLFETGAVGIELGGCYLGIGFVQECGLCNILINIYFHGFDKEIQELRLKTNRENPMFEGNEVVPGKGYDNVFFKPLKIYAVRYLDEILIITSGTKMLTMDLKSKVVEYLEKDLELSVDKVKTVIHSAVSEKIDFLGMELRAVTPSVLHPPMSEKAIRARKKFLRQKEVRKLELRNARETNRKKLGLKIMRNVFKKSKRSSGFNVDFQVEDEVRQIFTTWADEVVREYLESVDERAEWYHKLSAGDFLSLERIRNQLPRELVDSYDNFQEQVNKYLNPVKAKKALEEKEKRMEEEEEQIYAARTVEDLTKLCIKVDAPIELIRKVVKMVGFTNHMGRPRPISLLTVLEDAEIIKWYAGVATRWLDFFSCCHNFKSVKTIVSYHLRFSCILTLAEKHDSTKREAISHFTKDLKTFGLNGAEEVYFPTEREVKMMGDCNLSDPKPVDGPLTMALIRLASDEPPYRCIAHFCDRTDTTVYRIRLLKDHLNLKPLDEDKWVEGMGSMHGSLNTKCLPLCSDHISELYMGRLTFQDVDCTSFVDID